MNPALNQLIFLTPSVVSYALVMDRLNEHQLTGLLHQAIDDLCGRRTGVDVQKFASQATGCTEEDLVTDVRKLKDFLIMSGLTVRDKGGIDLNVSEDKKAIIYSNIELRRMEIKEGIVRFVSLNSNKPFLLDSDWKGYQTGGSGGFNRFHAKLIWKTNGGHYAPESTMTMEVDHKELSKLLDFLKKERDDDNNWKTDQ